MTKSDKTLEVRFFCPTHGTIIVVSSLPVKLEHCPVCSPDTPIEVSNPTERVREVRFSIGGTAYPPMDLEPRRSTNI